MADRARKEMVNTKGIEVNSKAKTMYAAEVASLDAKLNRALQNAPRERQAQVIANKTLASKKKSNPDWTPEEIKRAGQQALVAARAQVGASKKNVYVDITEKEWKAIQAGAISESKLKKILNNADIDELRQRATPRQTKSMTQSQINRAKAMSSSNFTLEQIAKALGVSTSTVSKYLKGA